MPEKERIREINRRAKKRYYEKNKEEINKKSKEWAKKNREKVKEIQKRFYFKNQEEQKKRSSEYYHLNKKMVIEKERRRNSKVEQKEKNRLKIKSYREKNKEKIKEYKKYFSETFPHIVEAHRLIRNAIRRKEIFRKKECEECMKECKTEAHHEDYSKPYDVIWLCKSCHSKQHRKFK